MTKATITRRDNLRKLIEQHDGPNALARRLGYKNAAFIVQMAGPHPTREVTEKTARSFEEKLGLPTNWLDTVGAIATQSPSPLPATTTPPSGMPSDMLSDVIRLVAQHLDEQGVKLAPAKLADVVMLVYTDAVEAGKPRSELIRRAVQLAK